MHANVQAFNCEAKIIISMSQIDVIFISIDGMLTFGKLRIFLNSKEIKIYQTYALKGVPQWLKSLFGN